MSLIEPRPSRPMPLRMTPLIDVVFILLVFFMLTSRLLPVDHLELANTTSGRSPSTGEPLPELTVTENGQLQWRDLTVPPGELLPKLVAAGITEVNLGTRAGTSLGAFTRTLSQLAERGIDAHWKRNSAKTP